MAMPQTAFRTRSAFYCHSTAAARRTQRAKMPLFQAFLRPSSAKVTDGLCIKDATTIDSSCGTGGFLVTAMTHVIGELEREFSEQIGRPRKEWDPDSIRVFQDRISDMAAHNYFGFDINPDLVKATKMNMVMNNDGSGNILQTNSLLPPHEWSDEFRAKLAEALGIPKSDIRNHTTLAYFDVIVTNPPLGTLLSRQKFMILFSSFEHLCGSGVSAYHQAFLSPPH